MYLQQRLISELVLGIYYANSLFLNGCFINTCTHILGSENGYSAGLHLEMIHSCHSVYMRACVCVRARVCLCMYVLSLIHI